MLCDFFEPQIFVCDCRVQTTPAFGEMSSLLQMPGLVVINSGLANLPNVWLYNAERFAASELGVQLQMCNKLVVKAKKSVFFCYCQWATSRRRTCALGSARSQCQEMFAAT